MYTEENLAMFIAKTKSLLNDLEAMNAGDAWYGGFTQWRQEWSIEGDEALVEWPNVEIVSNELTALLQEMEA